MSSTVRFLAVLSAVGAVWACGGTAARARVISQAHHDGPDPARAVLPEPQVKSPPGVLEYVMPGQPKEGYVRYGGGAFIVTDAARFRRPRMNSGTLSRNALVADLRGHPLRLVAALDSEEPNAQHYDLVRLDFSGKGDFRKAPVMQRTTLGADRIAREFTYEFKGWPLNVTLGSRELPLRIWCVYKERETGGRTPTRSFKIVIRLCAQGRCRFGDKLHTVRLHDCNANLRVNDPSKPMIEKGRLTLPQYCDLIRIDPAKGGRSQLAEAFYGHPVLVDGRLWNVTVSDDGKNLSAQPYDGPTGAVHIDHPSWEAGFLSKDRKVSLRGGAEPVPIPAGRYVMTFYQEDSLDAKGRPAATLGFYRSGLEGRHSAALDVAAGATQTIAIGSPLKGALQATQKGNKVLFKPVLTDVSGRPDLWFKGVRAPYWYPKVTITISDSTGKVLTELKRTCLWTRPMEWTVSPDLKGTFRASLQFPPDAFPLDCREVTFALK